MMSSSKFKYTFIIGCVTLALVIAGIKTLMAHGAFDPPKEGEKVSEVSKVLIGTHPIRQINENKNAKINQEYFLFSSQITGSVENTVTFAWQDRYTNVYRFTTLPLAQIHIKIDDENNYTPYVSFRWAANSINCSYDFNNKVDPCILYAVIVVNSKQWPTNINIPMIKKEE
jgi:hypothetical protein